MRQNTAVKFPAWISALVVAAAIHGVLFLPFAVGFSENIAVRHAAPLAESSQIILGVTVGWCVVASVWCALVANVLARKDNRWNGLHGLRLIAIVAGLTVALDLIDSPCLLSCPPLLLIVPILSYVAISNVSAPLEAESQEKIKHS